jgi:energy-coupling factor transporter ATP-binding protein EcfA2
MLEASLDNIEQKNESHPHPLLDVMEDTFEIWLKSRHKWLQTAASRLLAMGGSTPTHAELLYLTDLCLAEALKDKHAIFESIPKGAFSHPIIGKQLRIESLNNVYGVNAIKHNASLEFGSANLSVIYGTNGAGKSGFARLLKHVCGTRHKTELYPNVFLDVPTIPSANVYISKAGQQTSLAWSMDTGPINELRHTHVFDSHVATSYVNEKNECTYEPRKMRFISALVSICDKVAQVIEARKATLVKSLPIMPIEFVGTNAMNFISNLNGSTSNEDIAVACDFTVSEMSERLTLEATLKQTDLGKRLKELEEDKKILIQLRREIESIFDDLSDDKLTIVIAARIEAESKRKVANEDAEKVFADAALNGVGQESWRLLWAQARNYSETLAYPDHLFPVAEDGTRCVLCQQLLDDAAKARLLGFENFIKNGLDASARAAEQLLNQLLVAIPVAPTKEAWNLKLGLLRLDDATRDHLFEEISSRYKAFLNAKDKNQIGMLNSVSVVSALNALDEKLSNEVTVLQELQQAGKRDVLEQRLKALRAKEWLSQQQLAICSEVNRRKELAKLESAEMLVKTNTLTTKKNELARAELSSGYKARFEDELKSLGGVRIPVEPVPQQAGKAKITFELRLKGAIRNIPTHLVVSEGENRIISLAAFLADMTAVNLPTPFIFDDPISSLDQDFEERVVERLVDLAKTRQVIVFTHRLSLLTLIEDAVQHTTEAAKAANIPPSIALQVTAIRSLGIHKGLVGDLGVREGKPQKGFLKILQDEIPALRKFYDLGMVNEVDHSAKKICSEFRILLEITVERVLLNNVVKRFRRSITTLNRITSLAKINLADCELIDELVTKYSCFEHSQPVDIGAQLPTPDEFQQDVQAVLTWMSDFEKRSAKADNVELTHV